jgi:CIC family chloride channel protein
MGSIVQQILPASNDHLLPTVGIAAFLGAGYCTPLAGVAFVAEATGQPGFLVPALLAAAAAQLVMGGRSFSAYQQSERRVDR